MTFITISLIIVASILSFLAGVSTKSREQKWLTMSVIAVLLSLFATATYYEFNSEIDADLASTFVYFMAFGVVLPRLIANIVNQNRLGSPAIFISRNRKPVNWILTFLFFAYLAAMIMQPNRIRVSDGMPIYDEDYFRSRIGFLFLLVPSAILMTIAMLQRTAFCSNGLFYNGLLFDWSDFKSYSWKDEWLQIEKHSVKGGIHLVIPNESKSAVEELLNLKIQRVHFEEKRS